MTRQSVGTIGVLDKSLLVVEAVASGATTTGEVITATGLSKPTAHRLVGALSDHGLVRRDAAGRLVLGLRWIAYGQVAALAWPLLEIIRPVLEWLADATGESVQVYVRDGDERLCVDAVESTEELRTTVPVGARLPLDRGSAGRLLSDRPGGGDSTSIRRHWAESVEERAPGVASVSASFVVDGALAAISVSGPIERTTRTPGERYGDLVVTAADRIERLAAAAGRT